MIRYLLTLPSVFLILANGQFVGQFQGGPYLGDMYQGMGPPMMPLGPQQMRPMGPPIIPIEQMMGPPIMPMAPQPIMPMEPVMPMAQMMGPPMMPIEPMMPYGGQFQGPIGYGGPPMYGQTQFGFFDETNDEPASPENQPSPSPGPSRRSANTNVQSGIQQFGTGNMNLQGNIQQVAR